ncbi:MAG: hypothetical protein U1F07_11325 [Rubrivivax sp.]
MSTPERAARLHAAIASMSPQALAYRGLEPVREALLAWLAARKTTAAAAAAATGSTGAARAAAPAANADPAA